jgi:hypothetical protein
MSDLKHVLLLLAGGGCRANAQGWNNITIELWTHERDGLSENDFIVAAKLDELLAQPEVQQLMSKKQPEL